MTVMTKLKTGYDTKIIRLIDGWLYSSKNLYGSHRALKQSTRVFLSICMYSDSCGEVYVGKSAFPVLCKDFRSFDF